MGGEGSAPARLRPMSDAAVHADVASGATRSVACDVAGTDGDVDTAPRSVSWIGGGATASFSRAFGHVSPSFSGGVARAVEAWMRRRWKSARSSTVSRPPVARVDGGEAVLRGQTNVRHGARVDGDEAVLRGQTKVRRGARVDGPKPSSEARRRCGVMRGSMGPKPSSEARRRCGMVLGSMGPKPSSEARRRCGVMRGSMGPKPSSEARRTCGTVLGPVPDDCRVDGRLVSPVVAVLHSENPGPSRDELNAPGARRGPRLPERVHVLTVLVNRLTSTG
jgi:hypothetical protein